MMPHDLPPHHHPLNSRRNRGKGGGGMLILGLDVATSCGHALVDRQRGLSATICGAWHAEGENGEDKAGFLAANRLYGFLKEHRPAFCAIEMPQRSVTRFDRKRTDLTGEHSEATINPNALQLSALAGGVVAMLDAWKTPWGLIAPATWRSGYFGKGKKPNNGDWKQLAIDEALRQKIVLPSTKAAQRDAAEAIGIAVSWERCTFVPQRHQEAFMALRTDRRAAA
jgi:hypothetical protein